MEKQCKSLTIFCANTIVMWYWIINFQEVIKNQMAQGLSSLVQVSLSKCHAGNRVT